MPTPSGFLLTQVQTTIFTPGLQFRRGKILGHLLHRWGDRFNGEPIAMPLPASAPPELPQVVLNSDDARYRLQATPIRLDLFWQSQDLDETVDWPVLVDFVVEVFSSYLEATGTSIGRLACVVTRMRHDPAPAMSLAKHFCKRQWIEGPLNRPNDFELHAHKRFLMGDRYNVNSWFRCKTGTVEQKHEDKQTRSEVIVVLQDFNTLAEELDTHEYTLGETAAFFHLAPSELDKVLNLYFPEESRHE